MPLPMPAPSEGSAKKQGLTRRQQRKALEWLNELAEGRRKAVVLRVTKDGALQDVTEEEFVGR